MFWFFLFYPNYIRLKGGGGAFGFDLVLFPHKWLEIENAKVSNQREGIMSRPSVEEWALDILRATQARATCDRGRCAALILKDDRIIAAGYVGSPRGMPHCDEAGHEFQESWALTDVKPDAASDADAESGAEAASSAEATYYEAAPGQYLVRKKSCIRTIHAEQNAIAWAAREGVALMGGTLYCTLFPCQSCAKLIMQTGIETVVADFDYHSSAPSKALFDSVGISHKVIRQGEAYVP